MRPEFQHLIGRLKKLEGDRTEPLAAGAAKDFAEYKYLVGILIGLQMAAREIEDYGRAYEEDD